MGLFGALRRPHGLYGQTPVILLSVQGARKLLPPVSTLERTYKVNKKTIRDVDLKGKRVLVRVDFNVPIENGNITDDTRIVAAIPTLKAILDQHPRSVVLMSHLGRPKDKPEPQYSLKPVADELAKQLGKPVAFAEDPTSDAAVEKAN